MDLVADDAGAVAHDDVADPLELSAGEDVAPRVVGLGEQQGLRALGEEPVQPVEVDLGDLGGRRHLQEVLGATGDAGQPVLGVVARRREDQPARTTEDIDRHPHAGRHVHDRMHGLRLGRPAEVPRGPTGVRLGQVDVPPENRIPGDAVGKHPLHRPEHHRVDRVVHLGDPRRDHALRHAPLEGELEARLLLGEVDDRPPPPCGHAAQTCSRDATAATTRSTASSRGTPLSWRPSR